MAKKILLKPDHKLMNPDFDGYKLCSDADVTLYSQPVTEGVEGRPAGPTCYLGTRLEALHNHIFPDPFHPPSVYYFTSRGHLLKSSYSQDSRLSTGEVVWQADLSDEVAVQEGQEEEGEGEGTCKQYRATVSFPAPDLAVVSNGRGSFHFLHTGDRTTASNHSWLVSFEMETVRGVIVQTYVRSEAVRGQGDQGKVIECIMMSIITPSALNKNPEYVVADSQLAATKATSLHLLHWLTLTYNGAKWELSRSRALAGEGAIQYCSLDHTASGIIILAHKNYSYVADTECPIVKSKKIEKEEEAGTKFIFMQSDEDVTVWLSVGESLKGDVIVKVTTGDLSVKVKDSEVIQGHFSRSIQADLTTWTIGDGRLELVLPKSVEGERWESLFVAGEVVGEEVVEQDSEFNQRLAHLTSDKWNPDPRPEEAAYDPGELEACDHAGEELTLLHLAGSSHLTLATAHLGPTQHLFNAQIQERGPPAFCLRHDVDAVLWQPGEDGQDGYAHTNTYDAFGYVRASKMSAKFTCASSDLSYVVVGDAQSHIYVFYQPGVVGGGELRNRVSGRRVGRVARQLVISLRTHDHILGLHAAPGLLFVLTNKMLYLYCIPSS